MKAPFKYTSVKGGSKMYTKQTNDKLVPQDKACGTFLPDYSIITFPTATFPLSECNCMKYMPLLN
jgi:hypothetical protein